jgi:hypothetical protein
MRPRTAIAATAVLLTIVVVSSAQEASGPQGRHRAGAFAFTPRLILRDAGVDTNVFETLQDPVRDDVVVLRPELDGDVSLGGRLRLTGLGFAEVNYFRRQGEERSTDFYGEGEAVLTLGPVQVIGGGGGGQFTQRFSIDVDDRLKRQERRAHGELIWRVTPRVSLAATGRSEVLTFAPGVFRLGGDVKEAMDRNTLAGTGELRYTLTPRTNLLVAADALEDRFFSESPELPRVRRSYRYLGGLEIREEESGRLPSGKVLAGLREFPGTLAQGSPPYRGPALAADLVVPLGRIGRVHFEGGRDVLYASSLVDLGAVRYRNAFVYEHYRGEDALSLPLSLSLLVSAGFERARYLLPYPYPDASSLWDRVDHMWTGGVGLIRRFSDSFRIGANVAWARRVSSLPLFSYEGMTYGLSAEVVP